MQTTSGDSKQDQGLGGPASADRMCTWVGTPGAATTIKITMPPAAGVRQRDTATKQLRQRRGHDRAVGRRAGRVPQIQHLMGQQAIILHRTAGSVTSP